MAKPYKNFRTRLFVKFGDYRAPRRMNQYPVDPTYPRGFPYFDVVADPFRRSSRRDNEEEAQGGAGNIWKKFWGLGVAGGMLDNGHSPFCIVSIQMDTKSVSGKVSKEELLIELSRLNNLQYAALQRESYERMSTAAQDSYDRRRKLIGEICNLLANIPSSQ